MKITLKFLFVSLLFLSTGLYASTSTNGHDIEPPKAKNLFVLKTQKDLVGAQVEIYNSKGELITSQSLQKRKMIIDFGDAMFGMYTIKIVKGSSKKEFQYMKK
ncbi:hypothetical protein [Chryseolinea sp. H1M3-3]|uniref:hypothetical protein n=1 Tax=Chryseolinea sp. H1M3-3 TaxID=3034144 RepID=UPI0023EC2D9F|nr:hypothetical protein [Chryseolinea sp. H1M3-3]